MTQPVYCSPMATTVPVVPQEASIRLQTQPLNPVTVSFGDNDSSGRQLGLGFTPDNISFGRTTGPHREQSSSPRLMIMWTREPRVLTTRASPLVKNTLVQSTLQRRTVLVGSDNLSGLNAEDNDTVGVIVATDNRTYQWNHRTLLVKLRGEPTATSTSISSQTTVPPPWKHQGPPEFTWFRIN